MPKALLAVLAFCAIALIPIASLDTTFAVDWTNHTWMTAWYGAWMHTHFALPVVVNTNQVVGMPYPLFYGYFFYPLGGFLSILMGANVAMRLLCAAVLVWQGIEVYRLARRMSGDVWMGAAISGMTTFAIYPLTNLYNRAAVTEFIAAALLVVLTCRWLRFVLDGKGSLLWMAIGGAALLGIHPITALLGGGALTLIAVMTGFRDWRRVVLPVVAATVVCSPFVYAYAQFGSKLGLGGWNRLLIFTDSIDQPHVRFWPIPYDPRLDGAVNPAMVSTPHLDGQMNLPLLILCAWLLALALRTPSRDRRWFLLAFAWAAIAAAVTAVSVSETLAHALEPFLMFMQFVYRLITYTDLFLLLAALGFLMAMREVGNRKAAMTAVAVCAVFSAGRGIVKVVQPRYSETRGLPPGTRFGESVDGLANLAEYFYGSKMYATPRLYAEASTAGTVELPVLTGPNFGTVGARYAAAGRALKKTNVQAFPWNGLARNGVAIPEAELKQVESFLAIAPSPAQDAITYRFRPDPVWVALRALSWLTLLGCGVLEVVKRKRGGKSIPARLTGQDRISSVKRLRQRR